MPEENNVRDWKMLIGLGNNEAESNTVVNSAE